MSLGFESFKTPNKLLNFVTAPNFYWLTSENVMHNQSTEKSLETSSLMTQILYLANEDQKVFIVNMDLVDGIIGIKGTEG